MSCFSVIIEHTMLLKLLTSYFVVFKYRLIDLFLRDIISFFIFQTFDPILIILHLTSNSYEDNSSVIYFNTFPINFVTFITLPLFRNPLFRVTYTLRSGFPFG